MFFIHLYLPFHFERPIYELHEHGWSNRRIEEELGFDRRAVSRALKKRPPEEPTEQQASQSKCLIHQKRLDFFLAFFTRRFYQRFKFF